MDDAIAETHRLILRPWRLDEADRFFDMHRRNEVAQWIGGQPMADRTEAVALLERIQQRQADDPRFGSWAVVERSTNRPAGSVLLKALPDGDEEIEIGWHLHDDHVRSPGGVSDRDRARTSQRVMSRAKVAA